MILETIPQLSTLTREEQACLALELWDASMAGDVLLTPEQEAKIDEGIASHQANPEAVSTTEQVTERLREIKQRIKQSRQ